MNGDFMMGSMGSVCGEKVTLMAELAIKKNFLHIQKDKFNERVILNVKFNSLLPVGEMNVQNKREKVPVTSVILEFESQVNWKPCCENY